ncbi:uncharacterized protein LOC113355134 isoform X2 [Papaver somniferum]|uniref:uncharacterized protein LOC113355134 isoform X2 n=1 Tax=Papaver somniferum TaxID=3469 RepID=UPI000E6FA8A3|nr:uncharacterized protein LOC113355134 isoform X2 [Papaver somniferum]
MDSPFWNVLNFFIFGRRTHKADWWGINDAIMKIVTRYNSDTDEEHAFVFHDSENNPVIVKSSSEKLACFFGLKIVDFGIDSSRVLQTPSEIVSDSVVDRMQALIPGDKDDSQMQKSLIEKSILHIMRVKPEEQTEKDAEDLAKLFTLHLCVTIFFTQLNGSLSYKQFGGYFKTLHKMNRTYWPDLIHSYLMESIRGHIDSPGKVSRCGMYLLITLDCQGWRSSRWPVLLLQLKMMWVE